MSGRRDLEMKFFLLINFYLIFLGVAHQSGTTSAMVTFAANFYRGFGMDSSTWPMDQRAKFD